MKKISANGLYPDLSIDDYHSDCCDGPSISASGLHRLLNEAPAIYWATSALNPHRDTETAKRALDFGRAAHAMVLGEPEFAKYFVVSPYDDFRKKEAQEWRDGETRTIVRANEFPVILAMAAAQRQSPQVARAFRDGKPEQSLIWQDEETGVWLKSRPDWLPDDPAKGFLVDYKTARSIQPRILSSHAFQFGYHIQAALQVDGTRAVLGVEPLGIGHVCQEKTGPYLAELRLFTPEQIDFGRREYRRALTIFKKCWDAWRGGEPDIKAWPGYSTQPQFFDTPSWLKMENTDEQYDPNQFASRPLADDED